MPGFEIFGDEERKEVLDVLDTGILFRYNFDQVRSGHWKAGSFEKELTEKLDVGYCHLCSSGTAALSIALASCGIGAGDEVIVPPFTFVATFEAVLLAGATPVFADIDETLCLNPEAVKKAISPKTKAVVPVHMCGAMAQIDRLKNICDRKGVTLIEDACQSLGSTFEGKAIGSFGKAGCFSFDFVKTITCAEGGAVISNYEAVYKTADAYSDHGHDHIGNDRGLEDHLILGGNYRISELNAAVGLAQLRKLDKILELQRANKKVIKDAMAAFPDVTFRKLPDEAGDSATFLSFFMPDEDTTRATAKALSEAGVDGCFYWYDNNWHYIRQWGHLKKMAVAARLPMMLLDNFPDYGRLELPASDAIMGRAISMQIKLSWSQEAIEQRIEKICGVLKSI
ncbi:MAG: DegT/DnrJ/EryC1/StrS family aminotransferase [Desulfobacterales bacterium]|nr:DegT/DnrJ/EryC1/StrS family aminotransferase [Desulfobacterales bacterium]